MLFDMILCIMMFVLHNYNVFKDGCFEFDRIIGILGILLFAKISFIYYYINITIINSKANSISSKLVINSIHNYLNFISYHILKSNICKDGQFLILKH
jgi:hypothetical protein